MSNFKNTLERLSVIFGKILKKKVEFEIIKAQFPFQDSNILAQILGYNANKYKFRRMLKILIPRAVIKNPSKELIPAPSEGKKTLYVTEGKSLALGLLLKSKNEVGYKNGGVSDNGVASLVKREGIGARNLNMLLSQPSSYLPPFFYSKHNISRISLPLLSASSRVPCLFSSAAEHESIPSLACAESGERFAKHSTRLRKDSVAQLSNSSSLSSATLASLSASRDQLPCAKREIGSAAGLVFPSYLSGLNIKLAGRLMTQSIRPRFTVQSLQEGSLARVKVHFIEKSRFTGKNKRGAFSFTVTLSHVFNQ